MYASVLSAIAFAVLIAAKPSRLDSRDGNGQCATGTLSCCNNALSPHDAQAPLGQLGLGDLLNGIAGQVGVQCNPITGIGAGQGATCTQEPLCCDHDNYNGLISLGCNPVNVAA
ncbi:hydrophobin [Coniophora puteana RWD-64-598 SS2]|uniref:Hydrophobin n=1 Tax=Coniophora puteana (strain RWD-64-598) TaxID=741705 RepID=R7SEI6_CONPW|nr:hydrophobin [Coniophora puteana RWD-64-598 SS2]EIW74588.1 hydrophobin [Coniophora puteana RWD-64-598 SS2]